ncbi:Aste57867_15037 [Aphanomyces stellatus]|uniref:Aste57867_15037 protein n=1 Tax=Aphanomyces stellatus TaxID=120398 RepID=A0A485L286_9STRA|nr:hypothetical protein As57867_014981 [Aphanomyces stellatus]VFT91851.1 Aste57867_15037 [Aphanomyces stellatus]
MQRIGHVGLVERMRSYLLGIFLDVPVHELDAAFLRASANLPPAVPGTCDPHYFGGEPWGPHGATIPVAVQDKLVGTYVVTESPVYYGNITVFKTNASALFLRWGVYTAPVVATVDPTAFVVTIEIGAMTFPLQVDGLNKANTLVRGHASRSHCVAHVIRVMTWCRAVESTSFGVPVVQKRGLHIRQRHSTKIEVATGIIHGPEP